MAGEFIPGGSRPNPNQALLPEDDTRSGTSQSVTYADRESAGERFLRWAAENKLTAEDFSWLQWAAENKLTAEDFRQPAGRAAPAAPSPPPGGGGAPAGGGPAAPLDEAGIRDKAKSMAIGYMLDDPEVGPLIRDLINGVIDDTTFQNRLRETKWYQTTSPAAREWEARAARDPADAQAEIRAKLATVGDLASQMGVSDSGAIYSWTMRGLRLGWNDDQIRDALAGEVNFRKPRAGAAAALDTVAQLEANYAVHLGTGARQRMARRILDGSVDPTHLQAEFSDRARGLYGDNESLARALDEGKTVQDYAAPYMEMAASLLGVSDPSSIDLRKPKWRRILQGQQGRSWTANEWETMIRTRPEYDWEHSRMAQEMAAQDALSIDQFFGAA